LLEHWKAIPGYEGFYEVSDLGRIRSIDRFIYNRWSGKNDRSVKGKIRKTEEAHDGYRRVRLLRNGKTKKYFVHRLVMNAFKPNPNPEKYTQINHKNEITYDNRLDNLEWCTQTYNNTRGAS